MPKDKETQYAIWWNAPTKGYFEPGWVLDETYRVAVYASARSAGKDRRGFVHADEYEVKEYTKRTRSGG